MPESNLMLASPPGAWGDKPADVISNLERRGADITWRYPDVVETLEIAGPARAVLDCEIVVMSRGVPDFAGIHQRDAQGSPGAAKALAKKLPATLAPFDVLSDRGAITELLPYIDRREALEKIVALMPMDGVLLAPISPSGRALWQVVNNLGLEGLIAKRADSRYQRRRSQDWIKIKATKRVSVLVGGYDPGSGDRADTFSNLHMKLVGQDGQLVAVGKVGSGFSDRAARQIKELLVHHKHPIVIDVEYLEVTPHGSLRMPVFKGLRTDVDALSCTTDQLT
jgi:ATP-dependent DNA ligase